MEFVHEVTAYLENKPGRLAKICSALAHEKVNIQALSVMESTEHNSVLRLVVDDPAATKRVLTGLGTESETRDVLAVEMENRPGALAKLLESLAAENLNIEYAYVAPGAAPGKSLGIFHTSNTKKALQVLAGSSANGAAADRGGGSGRRPLHSR